MVRVARPAVDKKKKCNDCVYCTVFLQCTHNAINYTKKIYERTLIIEHNGQNNWQN